MEQSRAQARRHLIRAATPADHAAILALNAEWDHVTSPLDAQRLAHLHAQAAFVRVAESETGRIAAFVLALTHDADYDSPNFRWFVARYGSFLYVDRVVVAGSHVAEGIGSTLYAAVFAFAAERGISQIMAEVDLVPPNDVSAAFHDRWGFVEVGTQTLPSGKSVSLRRAPVRA